MTKRLALLLLLVCACIPAKAQDFQQSYNFINTGSNGPGVSFANTGITSFFVSWSPQATLFSCAVQVDSSTDGVSWGSADLISSQNCATTGSSGTPQSIASGKNFVRIRVTALTGNGGLNVTLKGWGGAGSGGITSVTSNPSGACTAGQANIVTTSGSIYSCGASKVWQLQGNPVFNMGYQGLAPQDFGGTGNGREAYDAVVTSGSAVVTSATAGFCDGGATACSGLEGNGQAKTTDVGRVIEIVCGSSSTGNRTILSVQSATQVTMSSTQSTCNGSPFQIFIGTDDTAALQSWIAAGMTLHTIHNFYLPKGTYYTSKPLFFNNTVAAECSAHVNPLQPIGCGITLLGAGATVSLIHPATQPNFNWTLNSAASEGIVHITGFSFGNIQAFAVEGDQVTHAAGLSTEAAGLYLTGNSHLYVNSIWINRVVTSGATKDYGLISTGCFECSFYNSAIEGNGNIGNASLTLSEKELWDTIFFETGSAGNGSNVALISGGGGASQIRFHNVHFQGNTAANVGQVLFVAGFQIARGQSVIFDSIRLDNGSTTDVGFWVSACTPVSGNGSIRLLGSDLINLQNAATARTMRVDSGVTCNITMEGGSLDAGGGTGVAVLNNSTTNPIYLADVNVTGAISGTGAGAVFGLQQTATGWGGAGGITGTYFGSDFTGAGVPTLSAGTGSCATTSTQVGGPWSGSFVCTGTAGAGTITIAPGTTASHGWKCQIDDITSGTAGSQSGTSATTCTMKITTAANTDVIGFLAVRY